MLCILLTMFTVLALPSDSPVRKQEFLDLQKSFEFSVDCGSWSPVKCKLANSALQDVGDLIAQQILFKVPIKVCVKMVPLENVIVASNMSSLISNSV